MGQALLALLVSTTLGPADDRAPGPVAPDTCLVHLLAPAAAKVALEGVDQGAKRDFTFPGLDPDSARLISFDVSPPGGPSQRRDVVLLPGQDLIVPALGGEVRREVVLQVGHSKAVTSLAFSPDGRYLYSGSDGGVVMWDPEGGVQLRTFRPRSRRMNSSLRFDTSVDSLAPSPDGRRLLAGVTDGCAYFWSIDTGELEHTSEGWMSGPHAAYSRDGRFYALGAFGGSGTDPVEIQRAEGNQFVRSLGPRGEDGDRSTSIVGLGFNPGGTRVVAAGNIFEFEKAAGSKDGKPVPPGYKHKEHVLLVWDAGDGRLIHRVRAHEDRMETLALSPAGDVAATASWDRSIATWDLDSGRLRQRFTTAECAEHVAFDPSGKSLIAALPNSKSKQSELKTWDLASGAETRTIPVEGSVSRLAIAPDGKRCAVGLKDGEVRVIDLESGVAGRVLRGRASATRSVAVGGDGRLMATGGNKESGLVWDVVRGTATRLVPALTSFDFQRLAFGPDGRTIVACDHSEAAAWATATGEPLWARKYEGDWIRSLAFAPDGSRVLVGGKHDTAAFVRLLDATTGEVRRDVPIPDGLRNSADVDSVAFAPDGRLAAAGYLATVAPAPGSGEAGGRHRGAWLIDGDAGALVRTFTEPQQGSGTIALQGHAAFGRRGTRLLFGAWELWDHRAAQKISLVEGHLNQIQDVAFTPDGSRLFTASWDRTVRLWDVASGRELRTFRGHTDQLECCAVSPNGRTAATGGSDGRVILWDLDSGELVRSLQVDDRAIYGVAFSPDGRSVLAGSLNGSAILWRVASGYKERTFSEGGSRVPAVAFSGDGSRILAGLGNGAACVWDRRTGQTLLTLRGHGDAVGAVAISPRGDRYLTGSTDRTAILWDAATGRALRTLRWHSNNLNQVAFSPDGRRVVTTSWDNPAMVWDAESGARVRSFQSSSSFGTPAVAFSPDGRLLATGSLDRHAAAWDIETGDRVQDFGAPVMTREIDASDDGRLVAAGTMAGEVKLYDAGSGRKLRDFPRQPSAVNGLRFTPGGRCLLVAYEEGVARLWDVATGDELAGLVMLDGGRAWLVATPEGLFDGPPGVEDAIGYRVGAGLDVRPAARMPTDQRRPGLLAALMRGERPTPPAATGQDPVSVKAAQ